MVHLGGFASLLGFIPTDWLFLNCCSFPFNSNCCFSSRQALPAFIIRKRHEFTVADYALLFRCWCTRQKRKERQKNNNEEEQTNTLGSSGIKCDHRTMAAKLTSLINWSNNFKMRVSEVLQRKWGEKGKRVILEGGSVKFPIRMFPLYLCTFIYVQCK